MSMRGIFLFRITIPLAFLPEVGVNLYDFLFLHPTADDGLHYCRFAVCQTQIYQIFLGEFFGQSIQIADVTLRGLSTDCSITQRINLVAINQQLIMTTTLSISDGKLDGSLSFLSTF